MSYLFSRDHASPSAHAQLIRPKLTEELKAAELPRELVMSFRGADFSSTNSELVSGWNGPRISFRKLVKTMVWICLNGGEGWKSLEWTVRRSNIGFIWIHKSFTFFSIFEPVIPRFMQMWTNRNLPGTWVKIYENSLNVPSIGTYKFIVDIFQGRVSNSELSTNVCLVQATKRCRRCNCWVLRFFLHIYAKTRKKRSKHRYFVAERSCPRQVLF